MIKATTLVQSKNFHFTFYFTIFFNFVIFKTCIFDISCVEKNTFIIHIKIYDINFCIKIWVWAHCAADLPRERELAVVAQLKENTCSCQEHKNRVTTNFIEILLFQYFVFI